MLYNKCHVMLYNMQGRIQNFLLGGGALVSCSTSTPIIHIVFFWQNTSCIRTPQVILGGGGAHPLHPPPRSTPDMCHVMLCYITYLMLSFIICVMLCYAI